MCVCMYVCMYVWKVVGVDKGVCVDNYDFFFFFCG